MKAGNTIVVGDKSYIQSKVVMLPTEKDYQIGQFGIWINKSIKGNELVCGKKTQEPYNMECVPQHLYFLSDEEIKEGWEGWAFKKDVKGQVFKHFYTTNSWYNDAKKIIATTDESFTLCSNSDHNEKCNCNLLPRPSNEFLQAYCKANGKIDEVLVEVEGNESDRKWFEKKFNMKLHHKLKIAPDNTITIKPVKDSWNKEEVCEKLREYREYVWKQGASLPDLENWIAQNL